MRALYNPLKGIYRALIPSFRVYGFRVRVFRLRALEKTSYDPPKPPKGFGASGFRGFGVSGFRGLGV